MTVHYTEFGENVEAPQPKAALASGTLATTETSAAFKAKTRYVKVHAVDASWVAYAPAGSPAPDATASPRIFIAAGQYDYIAVDGGGKIHVVTAT